MILFSKSKLFNVIVKYRGDYPGGGGWDTEHTRVERRVAAHPQDAIESVQRALNYGSGTIISLTAEEVAVYV